jgi:hypothetical protein
MKRYGISFAVGGWTLRLAALVLALVAGVAFGYFRKSKPKPKPMVREGQSIESAKLEYRLENASADVQVQLRGFETRITQAINVAKGKSDGKTTDSRHN